MDWLTNMSDVFYVDIDGVRQEAEGDVLNQILEDKKLAETKQAEAEAKEAQKLAIADRLGLTIDELKILLG
jgi:hypothetical protein